MRPYWLEINLCLKCIYSTFGPFKERIQMFKQTGDSRYIYKNELDKA